MKKERPGYVSLYKTAAWSALRRKLLHRRPLCVFCESEGRVTPATIADHIRPHKGDVKLFYCYDNLQPLCKRHHDSTKQKLEKLGEFGCDENGLVESWK